MNEANINKDIIMGDSIIVRVNRGEYVGGDIVFGTVYLYLSEDTQSKSLRLLIRGNETNGGDIKVNSGMRKEEKVFLKEDFKMIEYPKGFAKGSYSFPFQYQLPHGVPGVFSIKKNDEEEDVMEGNIKYSISAMLSHPTPSPKIKTEIPLIVYDSIDCRNADLIPSPVTSTDKVQYLVCFNRGNIQLKTRLNKSAYSCDETILVNVEFDNQSSIEVTGVTFTLNRVLRFFGRDVERDEIDLVDRKDLISVMAQTHNIEQDGTKINSWEETIDLKNCTKLPPTTSGSIVRCRYHLDVKIHCKHSLDIDQVQDVIIKPHNNRSWELWEPPSWIDSCTIGPVVAPLAVNREVLHSNVFNNIHGTSWRTSSLHQ